MGRSEDVREMLSRPAAHEPPNKYTLEDVLRWLEAKPFDAIVGYCQKKGECLVAMFLLEQGYCIPEVQPYSHDEERGPHMAWFFYEMQYCPIPEELAALAKRFDDLGMWNEGITAEAALKLFRGLPVEDTEE